MRDFDAYLLLLVSVPFVLFIIRIIYTIYRNWNGERELKESNLADHHTRQVVLANQLNENSGSPVVVNDKPPAYDDVMVAYAKYQNELAERNAAITTAATASTGTLETVVDVSPSSSNVFTVPITLNANNSPPSYEQHNQSNDSRV